MKKVEASSNCVHLKVEARQDFIEVQEGWQESLLQAVSGAIVEQFQHFADMNTNAQNDL